MQIHTSIHKTVYRYVWKPLETENHCKELAATAATTAAIATAAVAAAAATATAATLLLLLWKV